MENNKSTIFEKTMEQVMHDSMMPYAQYVIMDRAIPRVEDGLKPVQRRILYTMLELGLSPDKPHRKSARIVGDCLGKYHPHGDSSVYDAMVRLAQDFNMNMPLVDGHGNFGSVDGDPAAAMRYTEARLSPIALEMLRDIEKDTVPFSLNFDDNHQEPDILPSRYPNLLVNGSTGIAVGLATNIPPHNLKETIDATIMILQKPDTPLDALMKVIPGPDFPTGAYLIDNGLKNAYTTGRGKVIMRAKTKIEKLKNGKKLIVITELPYQVNKANALEKILKISEEKKNLFSSISDIRDESDRMGMRAVIELKKDADEEKILNLLYKYSDLQQSFSINMVAIAQGKPQQMGLISVLKHYINYQKDVVLKRTTYDLEGAQKRLHILQGLIIAIDNIDAVIRLIRGSKTIPEAKQKLIDTFELTAVQSQAILEMRLQRLTNLQIIELKKECDELEKLIEELTNIINNPEKLNQVIKKELLAIKKKYGIERRSVFIEENATIEIDESILKEVEENIIYYSETGFKRVLPKLFYSKNIMDEPSIKYLTNTFNDKKIQVFTNRGMMYTLDVEAIPFAKPKDRGIIPPALIQGWEDDEQIVAVFSFNEFPEDQSILFFTKLGMVKQTLIGQYNSRVKKLVACNLKDGDNIVNIELDNEANKNIIIITAKGSSIHFDKDSVPKTGRATAGVKAITLDNKDRVIFATQTSDEGEIIVISDRGYAKRSLICDYELQNRSGKGLKTFEFNKNKTNGEVLSDALYVKEPKDLIITQVHGEVTKINSEEIFIEKRAAKGKPLLLALMDNYAKEIFVDLHPVFDDHS